MKNELKQLRKETLMHGIEILFLVHVLHWCKNWYRDIFSTWCHDVYYMIILVFCGCKQFKK